MTERPLLAMAAPKPGKAPAHFADMDDAARADAVVALGLPAFRAKQLATHYFDHLSVDPEDMTDLAADVLRHRVTLSYEGLSEGLTPDGLIDRIMRAVQAPARVMEHEKLVA